MRTTHHDEVEDNESSSVEDKTQEEASIVSVDEAETAVHDQCTVPNQEDSHDAMMDCASKPKPKSYVRYILEDGTNVKARVLSQQPECTSKYGNWLNVQLDGQKKPSSINWDVVTAWQELPEPEQVIFLTASEEMSQGAVDAKEREIGNLENGVFEVVEQRNQRLISCKWIFTEYTRDNKKVIKARLVARGFEENIKNVRTDSPTCSRQSLRMTLITAPTMGWELNSMDITSAFLQGNGIK